MLDAKLDEAEPSTCKHVQFVVGIDFDGRHVDLHDRFDEGVANRDDLVHAATCAAAEAATRPHP
jgi:hypothetical protein